MAVGGDRSTMLILQHMDPVPTMVKFGSHKEEFSIGVALGYPLEPSSLLLEGFNLQHETIVLFQEIQFQVPQPLRGNIMRAALNARQSPFVAIEVFKNISKSMVVPLA